MDQNPIRLTTTVKKGGCAAKLPAGTLRKVLGSLQMPTLPELTVGTEKLDDACLWDLGDGRYLIQTLDFFTPIVDDAFDFGAIAATNALSDVYAMGGEPRIALTILAFPAAELPLELLDPLMKGAMAKIAEAGACLAGGHSIDDETLKLGFSVSGFVDQKQAWTNAGAKVGDALILTKGLGTGTLTTALKLGELPDEHARTAIASMTTLNRVRDLIGEHPVNAATDITGFGLLGHAMQVAQASGVQFKISASRLPALPGALECLREGYLNRAHRSNQEYTAERVAIDADVPEASRWLALDPQTSGGLLLAVPPTAAPAVVEALRARFAATQIIGEVAAASGAADILFTI